jgi:protoheme ferro-lyase
LGVVRYGLPQMEANHCNDEEEEVDANFDIFRKQMASQLAYKWQAREVEWLEPATVCRPFNSP